MTTTPRKRAPAKKPATASPADDGYVDIEYCGMTLHIPIGDNVPLDAYIAFGKGDELLGTELLLGEKQWAAFREKKPTVGDFNAIGEKLTDLLGN